MMGPSFFTKETVQQKYTPNQQVNKLPFGQSNGDARLSQSRAAPWLPVKLI
jgi:hypothetical protein